MIIIQFLQDLLHDSLTEEDSLCAHTKLFAILTYCCHLAIIQINNLPMATHKRLLLFLKIFGIYSHRLISLLSLCHCIIVLIA